MIEDQKDICNVLEGALIEAGFTVLCAYTGIEGIDVFEANEIDVVLLDIMLPYKSGDEVLRELRKSSDVPVIVISAKDIISTKVDLIKLGADDYITKPFDLDEVLARIEAVLRRSGNKLVQGKITYKDIVLFCNEKRVSVHGQSITLTVKEYHMLELFLRNQNKVFTKASLYERVWGEEYFGDDNVIKMHMSNLRTKLREVNPQEEYLETVWGIGYRLHKG